MVLTVDNNVDNHEALAMPTPTLRIPDIIMKKRDGHELTKEEIQFFINAICDTNNNGMIQESQIGAMLMAIYFKSMTFNESYMITKAMMSSGASFKWPKYQNRVVDKHSTGGVGDKISLPLAPALAACGLKVPMISGRGLGFTGGTLDKLEAIPGMNVNMSVSEIERLVDTVGCCIVGQTADLNPADRLLYATRDITSTVDSIPLIAGSIVSKKAIEGLDALVLDVKVGKAAFMKSLENAEKLGNYMHEISKKLGFKAGVFLTQHDNPLGRTIGNQIEIEETIECLHGNIPHDLEELVTQFGGYLLKSTGNAESIGEGAKQILQKLKNGEALKKWKEMIVGQGVSESVADLLCNKQYDQVFHKKASTVTHLKAPQSGYMKSIDALVLGVTASKLGAGRAKAGDAIAYEVGFRLLKTIGEPINKDEPWLEVNHNCPDFDKLYANLLTDAIEIVESPFKVPSNIIKIVE